MNKKDLKKLRLDERYVMTPALFLMRYGIECDHLNDDLTIQQLHYVLGNSLRHVSLEDVYVDKIYRGEIILIGKPNKFLPYYNPFRLCDTVTKTCKKATSQEFKQEIIDKISLSNLCEKFRVTGDSKYLDEIYDRLFLNEREENHPTKQKIYCHSKRRLYIDKIS